MRLLSKRDSHRNKRTELQVKHISAMMAKTESEKTTTNRLINPQAPDLWSLDSGSSQAKSPLLEHGRFKTESSAKLGA